jgi:hypothetical protein
MCVRRISKIPALVIEAHRLNDLSHERNYFLVQHGVGDGCPIMSFRQTANNRPVDFVLPVERGENRAQANLKQE